MSNHPKHVQEELARIQTRLTGGPDPFEHAGLYAAQQALCWAAEPENFRSPFATITRAPSEGEGLISEPG